MTLRPYLLLPVIQHYSWGKPASESLVAALCGQRGGSQPFAELWMGAHPKAPSSVRVGEHKVPLDTLVRERGKDILGARVAGRYSDIPFLFKVLSIGRPLSIQLHPSKEEARKLHAADPAHYPDANHKPEIAIALTPLELLYGVRQASELQRLLSAYPEISTLIPDSARRDPLQIQRSCFESVLESPMREYKDAVQLLASRLRRQNEQQREDSWFLRALSEFGETDKGLFCFYLMNLVRIPAGEAIFTGPHIPHAYLSGDLVECMANSDNVVRAGLSDKFQDRQALFQLLDYAAHEPQVLAPRAVAKQHGRSRFAPPIEEFFVDRFDQPGTFDLELDGPAIVLCLSGSAAIRWAGEQLDLGPGGIAFVPGALKECALEHRGGLAFLATVP